VKTEVAARRQQFAKPLLQRFVDAGRPVNVVAHYRARGYELELPGGRVLARADAIDDGRIAVDLAGVKVRARVVRRGHELTVFLDGASHRLELESRTNDDDADAAGSLAAPMPGAVIDVLVTPGQRVEKGAPLIILEAMKMQHTITAPADGTVTAVFFAKGEQVQDGVNLIEFEKEQESGVRR